MSISTAAPLAAPSPHAPCTYPVATGYDQSDTTENICLACEGPLDHDLHLVCSGCRVDVVAA